MHYKCYLHFCDTLSYLQCPIRCTSFVLCPMSYVLCPFSVPCPSSVQCPLPCVFCPISVLSVSSILCPISYLLCNVSWVVSCFMCRVSSVLWPLSFGMCSMSYVLNPMSSVISILTFKVSTCPECTFKFLIVQGYLKILELLHQLTSIMKE